MVIYYLWLIGCMFTLGATRTCDEAGDMGFGDWVWHILIWPVYLGAFVRDIFFEEECEDCKDDQESDGI